MLTRKKRKEIPNLKELIERYENFEPLDKLVKETNVSRQTLALRFRSEGVEIRPKGRVKGKSPIKKATETEEAIPSHTSVEPVRQIANL